MIPVSPFCLLNLRNLTPLSAAAVLLERNDMRALGIDHTARIARAHSRRRWGEQLVWRGERFHAHVAALEQERRGLGRRDKTALLVDGWALDNSRSLPHLERLIDEMDAVIEERGLRPWAHHGKPFLKDILPQRAWETHASILDFACAPEAVLPAARKAGFVPPLSGSLPPGIRLMESSTKFDPQPDGPWRQSQLWHIDYHCDPTIYLAVAIREITPDDGPLHYLGEAASARVAEALGYRGRGAPYRVNDEVMRSLVDSTEVRQFTGPPGTALWIDSSRCFHFGSRSPAKPRYQMQYSFVSPVRNDFSDLLRSQARYPVSSEDPLSRRLVLDRSLLDDRLPEQAE